MTAISSTNQSYLNYPKHAIANLKLNVWQAQIFATARINGSFGQGTYPRADFTVDTTSANWLSAISGMRVVVSSGANGSGTIRYEGALRATPTATSLKIAEIRYGYPGLARETWSPIADNDYVTIYSAIIPSAFETRAVASGGSITLYKLYDVAFDTVNPQTQYPRPQVNMGGWQQFDWVGTTLTKRFSFANSFSWLSSGLPGGWSASVNAGSASVNSVSLGGQYVDIDFTNTGQVALQLTYTDTNIPSGSSHRSSTAIRYYWVNDDALYPAFSDEFAIEILSDDNTQSDGGRVMRFRAIGADVASRLYFGQPALFTYDLFVGQDAWGDGITGETEWTQLSSELARISFAGYVSTFDTISIDSEGVETIEFVVENAIAFCERLTFKGLTMRGDIASIDGWDKVLNTYSYPSAIISAYIFDWHAPSVKALHDYYRDNDSGGYLDTNFTQQFPSIANGSIADAIRGQAYKLRAKAVLCMSSDGAVYLRQPRQTSTSPYYVHQWTDNEVVENLVYSRDLSPKLAALIGQYTIPNTIEVNYGIAQSLGLGTARATEPAFIAGNDDDGRQITGDLMAEAEAATPSFSLRVFGHWGDVCVLAHHEYHQFDLSAYDPLDFTDAQQAVITAVSNTWSSDSGEWTRTSTITFKPVFTGKKAESLGLVAGSITNAASMDKGREVFVFTNGVFTATNTALVILNSPYANGDTFTITLYCNGAWNVAGGGADTGFYVNGVQMSDAPCSGDSVSVSEEFTAGDSPVVFEWRAGTPSGTVTGTLWITVLPT